MVFSYLNYQELISFFAGILSTAAALYTYMNKRGLLPKYFRVDLENAEAEIQKYEKIGTELQRTLDSALRNVSPGEAEAIISQAEKYAAGGYTPGEALELGEMIIQATRAQEGKTWQQK